MRVDVGFRAEGGVIVGSWPGIGSYRSDREPSFVMDPGGDERRARKLRAGALRALDRRRAGVGLNFHGAAVAVGGDGVVLLGDSGAGKSTHAAALCARCEAALLADDIVFVDERDGRFVIVPSEEDHWLDGPSRRLAFAEGSADDAKVPIRARSVGREVPVTKIIVLERGATSDEPVLLRGAAALVPLSSSVIRLPIELETNERLVRDLDAMSALAKQAAILRWTPWYDVEGGGLSAFTSSVARG